MAKLTHLGIIADGNRRWAKANNLPSVEGHRRGLSVIKKLVRAAGETEIEYLTFYVFSAENWGRSADEVSHIMQLAESRIIKYAKELAANNAKLLILGSKKHVPAELSRMLDEAERITQESTGLTVGFCFNYGGEQEIADAANQALAVHGEITPESIQGSLYHPEVPNLDMVVRTSGEERISGFMLWRAAYAELMFIKKYFPEMEAGDIAKILTEYHKRERRFGK